MGVLGRQRYKEPGSGAVRLAPMPWSGRSVPSWHRRWRRGLVVVLVMSPSLAAGIYYGAFATDRYVSEAVFVLRSGNVAPAGFGGLSSLLTMMGLGQSQSDAQAVKAYLTSRDAAHQLGERLKLAGLFGPSGADRFSRFPNILFSPTEEGLYHYLQMRITVRLDEASGLQTLRVEAFTAPDAQRIAAELLDLAEQRVNALNARSERDAIGHAEEALAQAQQRLVDAQVALTEFRNRELMIDANRSAAAVIEIIAKLSSQLAEVRVEIAQRLAVSVASPGLAALRAQEAALSEQIREERGRVSSGDTGLAAKIAAFERLDLQHEFADKAVVAGLSALDLARSDARRQHVYLERVVAPNLPDEARAPRRLATIVTVLGLNVIGLSVAWLLFAGLREHAQTEMGD